MPISPYIARLRERIGTDLLLLPTVAVLPTDAQGRLLLVRDVASGRWMTIGGTIEPDEAPADAARREAKEEAGVTVVLTGLAAALGGPEYRVRYENGDEAACVAVVYDAVVAEGGPAPRADGDETSAVGWFTADEVRALDLGSLNRRLLEETFLRRGQPGEDVGSSP